MAARIRSTFWWRLTRKPALLRAEIQGSLPENYSPVSRWLPMTPQTTFGSCLEFLQKAASDPLIKEVSLSIGPLTCGLAKAQELSKQIHHVVASGKKVSAFIPRLSEQELLAASHCSSITLPFGANVSLKGFAGSATFFRGALEKLGLEPEVFRAGKYKSIADTFLQREMPPIVKDNLDRLLTETEKEYFQAIAERRSKSVDDVKALFTRPWLGIDLKKEGWIDNVVLSNDETTDASIKAIVTPTEYRRVSLRRGKSPSIAVIPILGNIVLGKGQPQRSVGDQDIIQLLRKAKESTKVKAVVLRVSSSGGSALASSLIAGEVLALRNVKPVVVSMGSVAASGGYYVSANASHIFCEPYTLTGSIGVFAMKLNASALLTRLGVGVGTVSHMPLALSHSMHKGLNDTERTYMQTTTDNIYNLFVTDVSLGRNLSVRDVHALAQGKVYVGREAVTVKLCDEIGGLPEAIRKADELSGGTPDVKANCIYYTPPRSARGLAQLIRFLPGSLTPDLAHMLQFFSKSEVPLAAALLATREGASMMSSLETVMSFGITGEPLALGPLEPL